MVENEQEYSFEEALSKLEQIVVSMEGGNVPLATMVAKYEEGSKLLKMCQKHLTEAQMKIEKLKGDALEPFEVESLAP